jgi:predicted ThiF/HesA family dinucleotide-utilizing enzyme
MHTVGMVVADLTSERLHARLNILGANEGAHALSGHWRESNIAHREDSAVKRFQMITEADARVLELGSTVVLVAGGHITPLAQDTLHARRVSVVGEHLTEDAAGLAPRADIRTVAIAGDHTSLALKRAIVAHLRGRGVAVHDLGTHHQRPGGLPGYGLNSGEGGGSR